jgi:phytoene dehydrogenase-like protein
MRSDVAVIGAGHNGLVAAAYLARAGLRTVVLERREVVGGACVTEELWPGFRISRAAYVAGLLRPALVRELGLGARGLRLLRREPASFTPLPEGGGLLLGADRRASCESIRRLSARDAGRYPDWERLLGALAREIEPLLDAPPPDPAHLAWRDLPLLARLARGALRLRRDLPQALELLLGPAGPVLERWFESEPLRATLATDAIIGAMLSPSTPGSGYILFHHVMGETDGARGVWGYVEGGMGALSEAIAASARRLGARIETGQAASAIIALDGRARGVALEDGSELRARAVLSAIDPRRTFLDLLPVGALPEEFRARIAHFDFSSCVTKINVALSRLPEFRAAPGAGPGPQHRGTIHFTGTLDEIERGYRDALDGRPSERPIIEMTIPSALDGTLAPPGKHVASLFIQYTPYQLAKGSWDDPGVKDRFADRVFEVIEDFAPGFSASVLHRDILSPLDLERVFGLTGGNIFHGAMGLDQLFWLRPAPGWSGYRTPLPRLYLAGAGAHPGGGVLGAPGRNAAAAALADFGRL